MAITITDSDVAKARELVMGWLRFGAGSSMIQADAIESLVMSAARTLAIDRADRQSDGTNKPSGIMSTYSTKPMRPERATSREGLPLGIVETKPMHAENKG